MHKKAIALASAVALSGCASMKPTYHTESTFVIYDVQPITLDRNQLLNTVLSAVQKSATKLRVNRDIPPRELPAIPGRFELQDPFANSKLGTLMATQAQSVRVPVCKNALMTVSTDDTSMARYGEQTTFFLCVLPYKDGYQLDIHATFTRVSGGFSPQGIGTAVGRSLVGDSSQFIPRTMASVRTAAESVGGKVTVVDSYIPEDFKGAFMNQVESASR